MEGGDIDGYGLVDEMQYSVNECHTPNCADALKPYLGRSFINFDVAVEFYKEYAAACGFDIHKGTVTKRFDGSIGRLLVYCNREGQKNATPDDINSSSTNQKRRRTSNRVGCMARVALKAFSAQGCVVSYFKEQHTHPLVSDEFKKYLKVNRNMGHVHQTFIMNCQRANIGAMRSFRLYKEVVGNYSEVQSTGNDWKNYVRDLKAYIIGCDAQIMLRKMCLKKENCPAFYFDYAVDKDDHLKCIFWTDPIARRNYSVFGDVVSFDCTYNTNRYKMIFAPFTGKDNHGKIVTFGAALMPSEDNTMYSWVFEKFIDCMGSPPNLIITDQDPAIKIAFERVLPNCTHRLYMWHIMMKVPEKVPYRLKKDDDFRKRLNAIVWSDSSDSSTFEQEWNDIMINFGLSDDSWFSNLYDIRKFWIPAFFRDIPMSGICRTTSISESVNSFFNHYLSKGSNLVEFFMHFDSAMDAQRHSIDILNSKDSSSVPLFKTPLQIERHAASVYTTNQFIKIQEEIEAACFRCSVVNVRSGDEGMIYEVEDGFNYSTVTCNKEDDSFVCSCNKFVRDGMLCCHIFLVLKNMKFVAIPEKYIVYRWTKEAFSKPLHDIGEISLDGYDDFDDNKRMLNNLISEFYALIGVVDGDKEKSQVLVNGFHELKEVIVSGGVDHTSSVSKSRLFESFYGMPKPDEVSVHPPLHVKTKGSGSRLKSRREAAIKRAERPLHMCRKCNTLSNHDSRNCKA